MCVCLCQNALARACCGPRSGHSWQGVYFFPINRPEPTILHKFTLLLYVLRSGFDVFFLDFDTVLMLDPLPHLRRRIEFADILVSRDFGTDCVNVGLFYLKAHRDVVDLVETLLLWMWHRPHHDDQKAFAGMLGVADLHDEKQFGTLLQKVPRWGYLDPLNRFVTNVVYFRDIEGWTGDIRNILVFHFLDGSGHVDDDRAQIGRYVNQFELFYANPQVDLSDVRRPLWEQDASIHRWLMRSWHSDAPRVLRSCETIDSGGMPRWKRLTELERERHRALHAALQRTRDWRPV